MINLSSPNFYTSCHIQNFVSTGLALDAVADAAEARKQMRKDKESGKKSQDEADVATERLATSTTAAGLAAKKVAESEALAKKVVGEKEEADRADKTAQDAAQSAREAL